MSKAFTRESDEVMDEPIAPMLSSSLPLGVKNYLTLEGANRLREELELLLHVERPRAAVLEPAEAKRQTHNLDQRIAQLSQVLQSAEVVSPSVDPEGSVRFGARVTVKNKSGKVSDYRIVGLDETDIDRGWVSWRSPLARSLLNARLGQQVNFKFPDGEENLEILRIAYS